LIITACQTPEFRRDVPSALACLEEMARAAEDRGAEIALFPECFLQGSPRSPQEAAEVALDLDSPEFAALLARLQPLRPTLVFGLVIREEERLYNAAIVIKQGRWLGRYRKINLLPGETFYTAGYSHPVFEADAHLFGLQICADLQEDGGVAALAEQGARIILCPCHNLLRRAAAEAWKDRHHELRQVLAARHRVWLISADVTGEDAERVSYGPTSFIDPRGRVVELVPLGAPGIVTVEINLSLPSPTT
jgi:predicted amidohydrolase